MPAWIGLMGFAASGSGAPAPPAAAEQQGQSFLLIGTGCYLLPLLTAALALGVH